jgi:hypothetical protein
MSSKVEEYGLPSSHGRYEIPAGGYESQDSDMPIMTNGVPALRRAAVIYRPVQLSEDETVLACCHHAHEVARAHGAREVMLEHLVHALARVSPATSVLEDRGINVEALRRDSAAVISSEIPVDHAVAYGQLRASRDFNTVMFLAAAGASNREEKATGVRDVLEALLRYDPKSRAVRLVKRHALGADLEDRADPMVEMRAAIERMLSDNRAAQERMASDLRDMRIAINDLKSAQTTLASEVASDRLAIGDRLKIIADASSATRADAGTLQRLVADRLQAVERAATQAVERVASQANGGSGQLQALIGDRFLLLQKLIDAQRTDTQRLETGMAERLKSLDPQRIDALIGERLKGVERAVDVRLADTSRSWTSLGERLTAIEDALTSQPRNGAAPAVDTRQLEERLDHLQRAVEGHRLDWQRIETGQGERMRAFERSIDAQLSGLGRNWSGMGERLSLIETAVRDGRGAPVDTAQIEARFTRHLDGEMSKVRSLLDGELSEVRQALVALGHAQQTLTTAIDEWRLNNSGDLSIISNRLQVLEHSTNGAMPTTLTTAAVQPPIATANATASSAGPSLASSQSAILDKVDRALKNRYSAQQGGV